MWLGTHQPASAGRRSACPGAMAGRPGLQAPTLAPPPPRPTPHAHTRSRTSPSQGIFKFHQYQVVGRHMPTESDPTPTVYRMKVWAPDSIKAKSKFW